MTGADIAEALRSARRVLVLGPSGGGKTMLSIVLAERLGLPVVHLDAHFWSEGWIATPHAEWRKAVSELSSADAWIMDGTYESTLDLRLAVADAVVVIERSRWLCLWNVIRRNLKYRKIERPDAPPGQPLDRAFLAYIWRYPGVTKELVDRLIDRHFSGPTIVLRGGGQVARLLSALK